MKIILVKFMILDLYRIMSILVDQKNKSAVSLKYHHSSTSKELEFFKAYIISKATLKASLLQDRRNGVTSLSLGK